MASGVIFADLHMLSGERQDSSELVGVATSPFLSFFKRRRGQLFTVVEPSLPDSGEICRRLIETIEDEYFRDSSRAVTTSLRHALAVANERLRAENSKASPDRQLRVGLSCAAVREGDVYIAQVAPANAFILHDGVVKRVFSTYSLIPDASGNGTDRASDSLGARLEPQVNFGFSLLGEGDLVVLASGPYWKLIPERYILEAAKHLDPEMAALDLYGCYTAHTRRPTTSLMVIRMSQLPARPRANGTGRKAEAGLPSTDLADLVVEPEPPETRLPGRARLPLKEESSAPVVEFPTRRAPAGDRPSPKERGTGGRWEDPPGEKGRERASVKPLGKDPRTVEKPPLAQRPSLWERLGLRRQRKARDLYPAGPTLEPVGRPSVRLRERWPEPRSERRTLSPWVLRAALMVLLAGLFVVTGNAGFNLWRSWQLGDPVALALEAQQKRSMAASAENQAAARGLLVQSLELYHRALRAKEEEATRSATTSVQVDIDRIDRTVRIGQVSPLVDYSGLVEEKGDVTQLVLDGNSLYVLDEGLDRLYRYTLTPEGKGVQDPEKHPVLVKRGDKLDGAVIGDLLSLAWMPAGQLRSSAALFVLESGRSLVTYDDKTGASRLEVSESQRWGSIQAINGFAGGLYLVDTKLKAVFYYPPTKNGYESQPYTIVDSKAKADLSKAADIALDGNLYVLEGGGAIRRFSREGRPMDFDGEMPDGGIKDPKRLYASANTRSLYVVDGVGERIVQFSPEGKLQRQFKVEGSGVSFRDLRDLHVDEAARKVYVLAHKSLFVFDLPAMQ